MVELVNDEVEGIWKEAVMTQQLPGGTEEDHKRAASG
jgi:hypothetical protein